MELEQLTALISEKHHGTIALIGLLIFAAGRAWTAVLRQGGLLDTLTQRGGLRGIYRAVVQGETPPKR